MAFTDDNLMIQQPGCIGFNLPIKGFLPKLLFMFFHHTIKEFNVAKA